MRKAEKKQEGWTHQENVNTPDDDFGLAAKWAPVSEAVNCLVVGDHLEGQSSVVLFLDRDIPKLSHGQMFCWLEVHQDTQQVHIS